MNVIYVAKINEVLDYLYPMYLDKADSNSIKYKLQG